MHYSALEKKQIEMGVSGYTAAQLRANDSQLRKDQMAWRDSQRGTLNLYMDDILFGAGGFIGFNTAIEVGIPAYADGLPYIQGTLSLKVINDFSAVSKTLCRYFWNVDCESHSRSVLSRVE